MSQREAKSALYDAFASVASALGNGRRAEIVDVLAQGERSVEEVAAEVGQSLAATSHHLRLLARSGLLRSRRQGTHVIYRLTSDPDLAQRFDSLLINGHKLIEQIRFQGVDANIRFFNSSKPVK